MGGEQVVLGCALTQGAESCSAQNERWIKTSFRMSSGHLAHSPPHRHSTDQGDAAMKTLALIAATAAVIATTTAASAHDYDREAGIDARRAEQAYRIRHN